jgi:hypothetical protein
MIVLPWVWMPGCGLFLTERDLVEAVDLDGDGVRGPAFGGEDCDDHDPSVFPGAEDPPYDGVDANCDGANDDDADGDGLADAGHGGADCDDTDPTIGAEPRFWSADCDDDGVAGTAGLYACSAPLRPLPPALEPCPTAAGTFTADPPAVPDCDDVDGGVFPGAEDPPYDGVDADCAGDNDFDVDRDGFVAARAGARPDALAPGVGDCDDADPDVFPGAIEVAYDDVDADCDGRNDWDADGDGFVADPTRAGGSAPFAGDCDDGDAAVHPGAGDVPYDGIDTDCDGGNDWDADRDGAVRTVDAARADGLAVGDCDDGDARRGPTAPEVWYDGVDQDCDGANDFDRDGDGAVRRGDEARAGGTAPDGGDCDDRAPTVRPGLVDAPYDGVDADCAGDDDHDVDGDGWPAASAGAPPGATDCDDGDPAVFPGALDAPYDGRDADCAGGNDYDADGDGSVADPYVLLALLPGGDCDDADPARSALLTERYYDGVDGDCAGGNDYDADGDGFASSAHPEGADPLTPATDCDDGDRFVHPGTTDAPYDGIDRDCGGDNDYDADGDGFVALAHAARAGGTAPRAGDCDDGRADVNPGAPDLAYDGVDADCAADDDFDRDGDGVRPPADCDDLDPRRSPLRVEQPYDGLDADCAGGSEYDLDGDGVVAIGFDGFAGPAEGVGDCDDTDDRVFPGAPDAPYDGLDADCDGANDYDADGDAHVALGFEARAGGSAPLLGDCDDLDPDTNPGALDDPADPADADCDGSPGDFDVDGDGVPVLTDCTSGGCDCDDTDATVWVGDRSVAAGEPLQPLLSAACPGAVLELGPGDHAGGVVIDRPLTLRGQPGAALRGGGRTLDVPGAGVVVEDLAIADGVGDEGACVRVAGELTLIDVPISRCAATGAGGGVHVTGALAAIGGGVADASAAEGGGVWVGPDAIVDWSDGTFTDDAASGSGGALFVSGGALWLAGARVTGGSAGLDGGALAARGGEVSVDGLSIDGARAGRWGGALLLEAGARGTLANVDATGTVTSGPFVGLGGMRLPSVVNLDEVGALAVERLHLSGNTAPVGVSVFRAAGLVEVHDLQVRSSGSALGVSLEASAGPAPGTTVRNLWVEGAYDGLRLAPNFGATAPTRVENATLVVAATGVSVTVFGSPVVVRNVIAWRTGFLGSGVLWTDYGQSSDLSHSFTVGGSGWTVGPPPLVTLPAGVAPAFCAGCADLPGDPFTGPTRELSATSGLVGQGEPALCLDPVTDPPTCLDPGYRGGPLAP